MTMNSDQQATAACARLGRLIADIVPVAVAVSGGVDSTTLAVLAHRHVPGRCTVFHAVSPAVPAAATARVERIAAAEGWRLEMIDAGELADPAYRANPRNRCFHCKTSLYRAIAAQSDAAVLSGTNLDDLGDFRPGLEAARAHGVRHPYVEAGITKAGVRAIAARLGYRDLAELPASPCLSSRVETGIRIEAGQLRLIDRVEGYVRRMSEARTIRCRLRREGVVIELDAPSLAALGRDRRAALSDGVERILSAAGAGREIRFAPYHRGSAFVGAPAP